MRAHARVLAAGAALVLLLSGCMRLDADLELQPDDTVDGSMVIAYSRALIEASGSDPEELTGQMREEMLGEDAPEITDVEPYEDDEYVGSRMVFEGSALDAFIAEDAMSITRDGDEFVVDGELDLTEVTTEQLQGFPEPDVSISITFPGAVAEHDGDLSGTTVTWVGVPGEVTSVQARGDAEPGPLGGVGDAVAGLATWVLVVIGVGLLLVVGLVVGLVLLARSRRKDPAGSGAPTTSLPPTPHEDGREGPKPPA